MNKFTYSDNKLTIFRNKYIRKYLKYFIFNSKHFTTLNILVHAILVHAS